MLKKLILISSVAALAACHNVPLKPEDALVKPDKIYATKLVTPAPGTVPVLVQRPAGHLGWTQTAYLYVDGAHFADLENGQRVSMQLPVGPHRIGVKIYDSNHPDVQVREVETAIADGGAYTFKVFIAGSAGFEIQRDYQRAE